MRRRRLSSRRELFLRELLEGIAAAGLPTALQTTLLTLGHQLALLLNLLPLRFDIIHCCAAACRARARKNFDDSFTRTIALERNLNSIQPFL